MDNKFIELTVKTLEKSEKGEDLHEFSNVDDLLKELHCWNSSLQASSNETQKERKLT